jgi:hypothetical protein
MTNEDWVKGWLATDTGRAFTRDHAEDWKSLQHHLSCGVLPEVDPAEGIAGPCPCGKAATGKDIRFLLSDYEFMSICPGCGSWQIFRTRKGNEKYGRL